MEKTFPRGGIIAAADKKGEGRENIVFGAVQRKISKKAKPKKSNKQVDYAQEISDTNDNIESVSAELLNYETIQDGMNVMGVVKATGALYLSISLPGRMVARVSALAVSNAYTKITGEFVENPERVENYKSLQSLFHIGQLVYGRVQNVSQTTQGRMYINLSLKPEDVHADLIHSNVRKGFIFNGAIEEVQEHGYIIETGIKGMRAFLPSQKSQITLAVGELLTLKVEKLSQDKSVSTCICKEICPTKSQVKSISDPNIDYLLPSTIVQFNVNKHLKNGLQGTIMNGAFTAYVNEHQLSEPLALPEDYELHSTINGRILYVMPLTKLVYLTLRTSSPVANNARQDSNVALPHFNRGDVVEDAKVHHIGTGGIILVLKNKYKGIISFKTIKSNYKGNYDQDQLLLKYTQKSEHKVRILDYNLMDSLYICTDDTKAVDEKYFVLEDVKAGDFVTAIVEEKCADSGGYRVKVGKLKGLIDNLFLSPNTKILEKKSNVRCRVIAVGKSLYLTNRPEYLNKSCKILCSLADARKNSTYTGTVVKTYETYVLVKFFNDIKGVLHREGSKELQSSEHLYVGQTLEFRILNRNGEQIQLSLPEDVFSMGMICPVVVTNVLESGLEIKVDYDEHEEMSEIKGFIPLRLLSDHIELLRAKLNMFPVNAQIPAACVTNNIFSLRDVPYFQNEETKEWRTVKVGDILKAVVKNVVEDVVHLMLPIKGYNRLVKLHLKMLQVKAFDKAIITLKPEQVIYVKILSKEKITKTLTVSAKLTDVWDRNLSSTADLVASYLEELREIKKRYKILMDPIAQYSVGDRAVARFQGVHPESNDWIFELNDTKILAIAKASCLERCTQPKVGHKQEVAILWVDYSNKLVIIANKPNDINHITNGKKIPPNLIGKSGLNAKIVFRDESLFICSLKKGPSPLVYCPTQVHYNDFEYSSSFNVKEGEFCRLAFIHDKKSIAVLEDTWKTWQRKRKLKADDKVQPKKILKNKKERSEKLPNQTNETVNVTESDSLQDIDPESLFYFDKTPERAEVINAKIAESNPTIQPKSLSGVSGFWSTDLGELNALKGTAVSSDEDEDFTPTPEKKRKLTATEKFKQQRAEESQIRAIEEQNADENHLPETVDQFDRLVLSEPNNSKNWINYMVFHLQSTEIDKARAVAQRAIKAMSYRNDDEQINIWVALLNLELRYGSKDSFDETLKQALTFNDQLKIYLRTLDILTSAKKTQELIEIITILTKKYKTPEVWRATANAYFSNGMADRAQPLLQKALHSLPERDHVNMIVAFANLHHRHGNDEMAQTLLDQVVTSYPKRVDVWTQYVDMLSKSNLIDSARAVLERAIVQPIPLKKMRTVYKKYLEFEERYGTDADVQKVKKLAADYVQKSENL